MSCQMATNSKPSKVTPVIRPRNYRGPQELSRDIGGASYDSLQLTESERRAIMGDLFEMTLLLMFCVVNRIMGAAIILFSPSVSNYSPTVTLLLNLLVEFTQLGIAVNLGQVILPNIMWDVSLLRNAFFVERGMNRALTLASKFSTLHQTRQQDQNSLSSMSLPLRKARIEHTMRLAAPMLADAFLVDLASAVASSIIFVAFGNSFSMEKRQCFEDYFNSTVMKDTSTPVMCLGFWNILSMLHVFTSIGSFCLKISFLRQSITLQKSLSAVSTKLDGFLKGNMSYLDALKYRQVDDGDITKTVAMRHFLCSINYPGEIDDNSIFRTIKLAGGHVVSACEMHRKYILLRELHSLDQVKEKQAKSLFSVSCLTYYSTIKRFVNLTDYSIIDRKGMKLVHYVELTRAFRSDIFDYLSPQQVTQFALEWSERARLLVAGIAARSKLLLQPVILFSDSVEKREFGTGDGYAKVLETFKCIVSIISQTPVKPMVILWKPNQFLKAIIDPFECGMDVIVADEMDVLLLHLGPNAIPSSIGGKLKVPKPRVQTACSTIKENPRDSWVPQKTYDLFQRLEGVSAANSYLQYFAEIPQSDIETVTTIHEVLCYLLRSRVYGEKGLHKNRNVLFHEKLSKISRYSGYRWTHRCMEACRKLKKFRKNWGAHSDIWVGPLVVFYIFRQNRGDKFATILEILAYLWNRASSTRKLVDYSLAISQGNLKLSDLELWDNLQSKAPVNPFLGMDAKNGCIVSLLWTSKYTRIGLENYTAGMTPVIEYMYHLLHSLNIRLGKLLKFQVVIDLSDCVYPKRAAHALVCFRKWQMMYPGMFTETAIGLCREVPRDYLAPRANAKDIITRNRSSAWERLYNSSLLTVTGLKNEEQLRNLHEKYISPAVLPTRLGGTRQGTGNLKTILNKVHPRFNELVDTLEQQALGQQTSIYNQSTLQTSPNKASGIRTPQTTDVIAGRLNKVLR
mmetsp:Transcript_10712/g.20094  ORF Transcript_10712/g.20094 Transcript_10712/m.20094 type:complete len:965 (+) Transcript_10712:605-3499(+)